VNPDPQFLRWLSLLGVAVAVTGVLFLLLLPKDDRDRRVRATGAFIFGMVLLVYVFLTKNPDVLESAEKYIALTLIGMVIATISVIRLLKK